MDEEQQMRSNTTTIDDNESTITHARYSKARCRVMTLAFLFLLILVILMVGFEKDQRDNSMPVDKLPVISTTIYSRLVEQNSRDGKFYSVLGLSQSHLDMEYIERIYNPIASAIDLGYTRTEITYCFRNGYYVSLGEIETMLNNISMEYKELGYLIKFSEQYIYTAAGYYSSNLCIYLLVDIRVYI